MVIRMFSVIQANSHCSSHHSFHSDLANPKTNRNKTAGFTDQERDNFTRLLNSGIYYFNVTIEIPKNSPVLCQVYD